MSATLQKITISLCNIVQIIYAGANKPIGLHMWHETIFIIYFYNINFTQSYTRLI